MKLRFCYIIFLILFSTVAFAQVKVSGNVYDITKINPVLGVLVKSVKGKQTQTDSVGHYDITVAEDDSIYFIYQDKPTQLYAVKKMPTPNEFDVSIHISLPTKYKSLEEIIVYGNNYKSDSILNRLEYAKAFNYRKPSQNLLGSSGLDADEIINLFRFRRNRQMLALQNRLILEEQEKYVDFMFNKRIVKIVTKLEGDSLNLFMKLYRPSYDFVVLGSAEEFNRYIRKAYLHFISGTSLPFLYFEENDTFQ